MVAEGTLWQKRNMKWSRLTPPFRPLSRAALAAACAFCLLPAASSADPETEARYPFDPACPWGRIANGKGMLHRCLSQAEAEQIFSADRNAPKGSLPESKVPAPGGDASPPQVSTGPVSVQLVQIHASEGEISFGKLGKPMDRYRECIEENGGLTLDKGALTLSFLVRAELVRAEGVEVKRFAGISKKAARCIADVVDRRQTGTPSVAMTGVELSFEITRAK